MEYLLDSTWAVAYLRGRPDVVKAVDDRRAAGLALSVVTLAELFSGITRGRNPAQAQEDLSQFLGDVQILGIDESICRIWGREDARLTVAGTPIGDLDLFIAATALAHNLTVCSQNRKHFERVPGLKLVSV